MNKRFTNFPNIRANIDELAEQYDPERPCPDGSYFNWADAELLGIISKLAYELSVVQQRVYDLEHPNQDELTKLCIPKKQ